MDTQDNARTLSPSFESNGMPLGQRLRQAREAKGISLEQASSHTHILKRHLVALEANDFAALPQPTFARGFAQSYARFLGLDKDAITESFDREYPAQLKESANIVRAPVQPMGTLQRDARPTLKFNPLILVGVLVALVLAFFVFRTVTHAHKDTEPQPVDTTLTPQEQVSGAAIDTTGSTFNNSGSAIGDATGLNSAGSAIDNGASAAVGAATLDVLIKNPTTVNITDATGSAIMQGQQTAGTYSLSGQPPFNVQIDNVDRVGLDLNKQPIKLSQYAQNGQANFSLAP